MPTLTLKLSPALPAERLEALAKALTRITAQTLGKRAEVTAVLIEPLPAQAWFIGGEPLQGASAWLEICITAGTNSEAQKAAFVEQAHAELRRQLGQDKVFETASYVIVHELPATDWGYAGHTQRARQLDQTASARPIEPGTASAMNSSPATAPAACAS